MNEREDIQDWRQLAELASKEQNPTKLTELLRKLNEALDKHLHRQPAKNGDRQLFPWMNRCSPTRAANATANPGQALHLWNGVRKFC